MIGKGKFLDRKAILAAVGGAMLAFFGNLGIETINEHFRNKENARIEVRERKAVASRMAAEFEELGDTPHHAAEYILTGRDGSLNDVNIITRHFKKIVRIIINEETDIDYIALNYGGRLAYWFERFKEISLDLSPASRKFTKEEKQNYALLANALDSVWNQYQKATENSETGLSPTIIDAMSATDAASEAAAE